MSSNVAFVVGMIAGAIAIDYLELRYRAIKTERRLKHAENKSHDYIKPLKALRLNKEGSK